MVFVCFLRLGLYVALTVQELCDLLVLDAEMKGMNHHTQDGSIVCLLIFSKHFVIFSKCTKQYTVSSMWRQYR